MRYTTVEAFTNHFLGALHSGGIDAFKDEYRRADVLLVDDVQFLQSKVKTEQEFFHTFNAVHEAGAQLVLTSDRLPRDMDALEDRLRERFEAGLVTDIAPPDFGTRLTILRKRVLQDELLDVVTATRSSSSLDRVDQNIRALEGALIRVVAFASLTRHPVDRRARRRGARRPLSRPQARAPHRARDPGGDLRGLRRLAGAVVLDRAQPPRSPGPRQVAMYLARELTDATLPAIGRHFQRNHTTVMHACRRTADRIAADPQAYETVRRLTETLR